MIDIEWPILRHIAAGLASAPVSIFILYDGIERNHSQRRMLTVGPNLFRRRHHAHNAIGHRYHDGRNSAMPSTIRDYSCIYMALLLLFDADFFLVLAERGMIR